jgi:choline dehydrogenase-like flavoprotein
LTAKSNPNLGFPNFQLSLGIPGRQSLESSDPFVQKGWNGVRNTPGLSTSFNRNDFSNILLDPTNANANPVSGSPAFAPIMSDPTKFMGITVEQEENNRSSGYIQLLSNDPTVPPRIIFNYLQDPNDLQDWMDLWNNNILPLLLALRPSGYFQDLLFPSPADILVAPTISFTSMAQVDQVKLANFLKSHVGGHHAGGTCKMGVPSDPSAVVDQKGQVYGTQRLRICDASIFPTSIWWPNVGLYVIGEKISHDILTKYGN